MSNQKQSKADSALKWYFSKERFDKDEFEGFQVVVNGKTANPIPVAGDEDLVSACFDWTDQTDDGLKRTGVPKSHEKASEAARLVTKHLNKTDWQPQL